jgi:hypothetical protein
VSEYTDGSEHRFVGGGNAHSDQASQPLQQGIHRQDSSSPVI